jgi:hypothetical protein
MYTFTDKQADDAIRVTFTSDAGEDAARTRTFSLIFPVAAATPAKARRYVRHGAGLEMTEAMLFADAAAEGVDVPRLDEPEISSDVDAKILSRLDEIARLANTHIRNETGETEDGRKASQRALRAGLAENLDDWTFSVGSAARKSARMKKAMALSATHTLDRLNRLGAVATQLTDKLSRMETDGTMDRLPRKVAAKVRERLARVRAHAAAAAAFEATLAGEGIDD